MRNERIGRLMVLGLAIGLWNGATPAGADDAQTSAAPIEKAAVAFRVSTEQWMPEDRFDALLALLEKYPGTADEITLFHSVIHAPIPLDEVERRAAVAKDRMDAARRHGFRTGINILTTIGHHEEDLPGALAGDYTPMTDIHGSVCRGSMCPNDENMRRYIARLYEITAAAAPDYIWIDDDVRLAGHMPIHLTCFCDNCLAIFAKEWGTAHTRDSLARALVTGSTAERLAIRKAWLAHNRATIARLFDLIEKTAHGHSPALPLGFMTGDRFFEGYDFDNWADVLAGPNRAEVMWRPGGGFYNDQWTPGLAQKSHAVGRQVAALPPYVRSIQSEIENFPYQRLMKSANVTVLEAASHIGAGCTGAAFNVLAPNDEPLDEFEPIVARIHRARPFLDLLARNLGRLPRVGVYPVWCKDSAAGSDLAGGNWFAFGGFVNTHGPRMHELGLPACYARQSASVTLVSGDITAPLTDAQVREILAGGVYMDAAGLDYLNGRGFGDLTGFTVERSLHVDCIERLAAHPINGPFAGRMRDCRQSFNKWPAAVLVRTDEKAQSLAGLVDYTNADVADCTMGLFENRLGGRICVAGYFPWSFMHNLSKSSQLKTVHRWLSKDTLPGWVDSFQMVNLWMVEPGESTLAAALTNSSFDPAEDLALMLRTESDEIAVFDMQCNRQTVRAVATDGPYRRFVLPTIPPWQMRLIVTEVDN